MAELCFGFVPKGVLDDLVDVGNWKKRAQAVWALHDSFVRLPDKASVLPQLPALLEFVLQLLSDHNFRVALSGLQLLTDLSGALPESLTPHLRVLVPALVAKLFDGHQAVREAGQRVLCGIMTPRTAGGLVDMLAPLIDGTSSGVPVQVKEQVITTLIMALLSGRAHACDPVRLIEVLLPAISSPETALSSVAMEALACVHQLRGPVALQQHLRAAGGSELLISTVLQANIQNFLPSLSPTGLVQHKLVPQQPPAARAAPDRAPDPSSRGSLEGWLQETVAGPSAAAGGLMGPSARSASSAGQLSWGIKGSSALRSSGSFKSAASSSSAAAAAGGAPPGGGTGWHHGGNSSVGVGVGVGAAGLEAIGSARAQGEDPGATARWDLGSAGSPDPFWSPSPDSFEDSVSRMLRKSTSSLNGSMGSSARGTPDAGTPTAADGIRADLPKSRFFPPEVGSCSGWLLRPSNDDRPLAAPSTASSAAAAAPAPDLLHAGAHVGGTVGAAPAGQVQSGSAGSSGLSCLTWFQRSIPAEKPGPGATAAAAAAAAAASTEAGAAGRTSRPPSTAGRNGINPWSITLTDYNWAAGSGQAAAAGAGSAFLGPVGADAGLGKVDRSPSCRIGTAASAAAENAQDSLSGGWVAGRTETTSPNRGERLANLKRRQQEKRAGTAVGAARPSDAGGGADTASCQPITPPEGLLPWGRPFEAAASAHGIAGAAAAAPLLSWTTPAAAAAASCRSADGGGAAAAGRAVLAEPPSQWARPGQAASLWGFGADRPDAFDGGEPSPSSSSTRCGSTAEADLGSRGSPSPTKLSRRGRPLPPTSSGGAAPPVGSLPGTPVRSGSTTERATPADEQQGDLSPVKDPEACVRAVISKLQACNAAARKELDWQAQQDALLEARRLVAHHVDVLRPVLHDFVLAAAPAIDQLRSTTARGALVLFQELFVALGRGLDREVDEVVAPLLKKAAEVSTAGRDNFLAQEADRALSVLCECASEQRCMAALLAHVGHRAPHARTRVAAHLDELCSGGALQGLAAANWTMLERLFRAAAGFLAEGSLDTRTHGKRCLWAVRAAVANRSDWERLVGGVGPEQLQRKVAEVLDLATGCPPFPSSRGASTGGRSPTRGRGTTPAPPSPGGIMLGSPSSLTRGGMGTPDTFAAGPGSPLTRGSCSSGSNNSSSHHMQQQQQQQTTPGSPMLVRGSTVQHGPGGQWGSYNSGGPTPTSAVELGPPAGGSLASRRRALQPTASARRRLSLAAGDDDAGAGGSCGALTAQGLGAPCYAPLGPPPPGSGPPPAPQHATPELTAAVDKVTQHMGSKDWRERCDALRALVVLLPAVPSLPDGMLQELLGALVARLGDGNAKVNEQALEALAEALPVVADRVAPALPALSGPLVVGLGSGNERVRSVALQALGALLSSCSLAVPVVPVLCHAALNSCSVKGKGAVVSCLTGLAVQLHQACPALTAKHLLPACGTLLSEPRGELRAPATELLLRCAQLLGPLLAAAVDACAPPIAKKLREQLLLAGYGDM